MIQHGGTTDGGQGNVIVDCQEFQTDDKHASFGIGLSGRRIYDQGKGVGFIWQELDIQVYFCRRKSPEVWRSKMSQERNPCYDKKLTDGVQSEPFVINI